jgi:hypothetical protein
MTAPDAAAAQVDRLLAQLRSDPRAAAVADELVRCLVQLYGAGLRRIVAIVGPERGPELCADPLVESLLLVHDLHPVDAGTRIRRALEHARPRIGAVEVLGIDEAGIVRLRASADGPGCRSSARQAIETIVRQAAPDTAGVEMETPLLQIARRRDG